MKKILLFSLLAVAILVFAGCSKKAVRTDDADITSAANVVVGEVLIDAGVYVADIDKSSVNWMGDEYTGSAQTGTVSLKRSELEIIDNNIVGGKFVIDMTSIADDDGSDSLEEHLKGDDFFSTVTYPEAVLELKSARLLKTNHEGLPVFETVGNLTIRDITKEITFESVINALRGELTAYTHLILDRTEWGVEYGSGKFFEDLKDQVIKDEMVFDIMIEADIQ